MSHSVTTSLQHRQIHRITLDNGMVVIAGENPAADIIAARIFIKAGSRYEAREQAGIFNLISAVLTKGTDKLSSLEIAERVESIGASLSADSAADYCILSIKTVSADFAEVLELAAHLLRSPTFPEAEVELEQRLTLQSIRSMQEQPFSIAYDQLRRLMYQDHPYALSGLGTEATVAQLSRKDLQHCHQAYFRPDNMVISIVGRITPEDAIALANQAFGDWQSPPDPLPKSFLPPLSPQANQVITAQETQQSIVMVSYLAADVRNADYPALKLLNTYLGNGLSSRLFVELREKQGLAYEVSAFYPTRLNTSHFVVYMGTAPGNTAIALEGLQREVERLCTTPLTPEELQAVKNKLLGQYALGKQTNSQIAQVLGWYEILGLGISFDDQFQQDIATVTAETAQQVACCHFAKPYISLVGPAAVVNTVTIKS